MIIARDLMRPCPSIPEGTTIAELVKIISSDREYCLAVVNKTGKLTGIITETDLIRMIYGSGVYDTDVGVAGHVPVYLGMNTEQLRALSAADIMTEEPEALAPNVSLEDLVGTMHRNRRKVLLIAEGGKVLGAVHRMDIITKVLG